MDDLDKYKKLVARNMNNWLAHRDQLGTARHTQPRVSRTHSRSLSGCDLVGKLDLEHEKLTDIPSIVWGLRQNVHSLILKDNLLSSIPLSIADLSALRRLDLTGNDLRYLSTQAPLMCSIRCTHRVCVVRRQLPQSLAQLVGLQDLFLTSNSFETFPLVVLRVRPPHLTHSLNRNQSPLHPYTCRTTPHSCRNSNGSISKTIC